MKVLYPKNIKKGILAGMSFQVGPLSISIIQLFILALGIALALAVFNATGKGSRAVGLIFAVPIFIIFVVIAFFKVSEMSLIPFLAKLARTYIFDTTKKFQTNYDKPSPEKVTLAEAKSKEQKKKIEYKKNADIDNKLLKDIQDSDLL